jgi:hypothetical protein
MNKALALFYKCLSAESCVADRSTRLLEVNACLSICNGSLPARTLTGEQDHLTKIAKMQDFYVDGMECTLSQC